MRRLVCACVVRKPPKTGFLASRPVTVHRHRKLFNMEGGGAKPARPSSILGGGGIAECTYTCMQAHTHVCIHMFMLLNARTPMHACLHMHLCIFIHLHPNIKIKASNVYEKKIVSGYYIALKTYAVVSHAHFSCVGKQRKLSGSCLSTIYEHFFRYFYVRWIYPQFLDINVNKVSF